MLNLQNQLETCIAGREYERIKQKHEKSRLEVKTSGMYDTGIIGEGLQLLKKS